MSVLQNIASMWVGGLLTLASLPVCASPVLVLKGPDSAPYNEALNGFRQAYSGGVEMEHGKTHEFLTRIHTDPPPLIVAIGRASAAMAHQRASSIPLVFVMVPNPAESGLAGSNIAGVSMDISGTVQLTRFKQLLPYPKKPVAILYSPAHSAPLVDEVQKAAPGLDLLLEQVPVESPEQVRPRIELVKPVIGAIWVVPDESFVVKDRANKWFTFLLNETTELHVPFLVTMNAGSTFVQEGALAAVVSDFLGMGRQCGELVKQIEAGQIKIENVGIRPPLATRWEVNLATAEKIGLTLPGAVVQSAKTYR